MSLTRKSEMDIVKSKADTALSKVSKSFSWQNHPVQIGGVMKVVQMQELRNAVDYAHDNMTEGINDSICRSNCHDDSYRSDRSNNNDHSDDGSDYRDDSDHGYCSDDNYDSDRSRNSN